MASIKIRDFFNGRFFEIPKYQRGYAWEVQNIRDLFDDIVESIESDSNHYIGTIVLSKSENDDEKFYVVDGQQRTTTVTLIISKIGEPQNKSQRFLKDAIEEINFKVEQIDDKLKFLKSVEKLEVMEFVENSEGDAIRIFQTVNDRGKPLSNMEKAKSLLIYFSNRKDGDKYPEMERFINSYISSLKEFFENCKTVLERAKDDAKYYKGIYGNRALNHIFITYCEHINGDNDFKIDELKELVSKIPNIEHILSQTPTFDPIALGFENKEDFIDYEHYIGNLTILEKGLNSSVLNKNAIDKIDGYGRSAFVMTKKLGSAIDTSKGFNKSDLQTRTKKIAQYCSDRWWSDKAEDTPETTIKIEEENIDLTKPSH
ncbi:hypothetical protein CHS0354_000515 [Potamilus streckersoni]|uniref:DUF262 domain-containing protein n=1 Tax=Potamilus streckersoni TaxID=2493646 RepID=A0AAE0T7Y8_9BIVA|nr:hypothetical protein CHS0354_000515 [Potamilus streckersoni]